MYELGLLYMNAIQRAELLIQLSKESQYLMSISQWTVNMLAELGLIRSAPTYFPSEQVFLEKILRQQLAACFSKSTSQVCLLFH